MALFRGDGAFKDLAGIGTQPAEVRRAWQGLITTPGVFPGGAATLVQGHTSMAYSVGTAVWATSYGGTDGYHVWGNRGTILVGATGEGSTVPAAPGSGLSRYDVIYALHTSRGEQGATDTTVTVSVAVGTAASSPSVPSIPTGALELARNLMTSSATTTASAGNSISQTAPVARWVGLEDTDWQIPTMLNGWSSVSPDRSVRYRRLNGVVYLEGTCSGGSATPIFTLPTGFRPRVNKRHLQQSGTSGTTSVAVVVDKDSGQVAASTGLVPNLDGIIFIAGG